MAFKLLGSEEEVFNVFLLPEKMQNVSPFLEKSLGRAPPKSSSIMR